MEASIEITKEYYNVLLECYQNDRLLLEKYHRLAPVGLSEAVNDTVDLFHKIPDLIMYTILHEGKFAAYFCRENFQENQAMTGFFILPKYRNKEGVEMFWKCVRSKFEDDIYCGIYPNNIRAISFLEKAGFVLFSSNGGLIFKLNKVFS